MEKGSIFNDSLHRGSRNVQTFENFNAEVDETKVDYFLNGVIQ